MYLGLFVDTQQSNDHCTLEYTHQTAPPPPPQKKGAKKIVPELPCKYGGRQASNVATVAPPTSDTEFDRVTMDSVSPSPWCGLYMYIYNPKQKK